MSTQDTDGEVGRNINKVVVGAGVILLVATILGIWFAWDFVQSERERDIQAWERSQSIVADSRAQAVNEWVDFQFQVLRDLADNASLQLYMTEVALARSGDSALDVDGAELAFLRNLLIATASSGGFEAPPAGPDIDANVERVGRAGLALTDIQGNIMVATPDMPPQSPQLNVAIAQAAGGAAAFADLHLGVAGDPSIGFALPVYAIQEDAGSSQAIGLIVGLKVVGRELFDRLRQPGEIVESAESYLVRLSGETIEYLSPLSDGTRPLTLTLPNDPAKRAAAFVIDRPGGFSEDHTDYKNRPVLVTGRQIARLPWHLVRTIERNEALAEIEGRTRTLTIVFGLLIVGMFVVLIAVWRHGTSLRAAQAAERYRISSERFENLTKFMRVVTDGQPTSIVAVDGEGTYTFANKSAADEAGMNQQDMLDKTMINDIGPVRAKIYQEVNKGVLSAFQRSSAINTFLDADGDEQIIKSEHIPLREDAEYPPGVLMVLEDITELSRERERRERIMKQLVETLVGVVDRRDPFAAHHSTRVGEVARAIAQEMGLEEVDLQTVDIAGNLLSLGKIVVPEELLTKTEGLTDDERATLRDSVLTSAEMVRGVEFDGPVVEVLEQLLERWDGSGPKGLKEEEIQLDARIVAVANAFVGMASARAYRAAIPIEDACANLMGDAGAVFDRRPVSALLNYLENRGGRERWAHFAEPPEAGAE